MNETVEKTLYDFLVAVQTIKLYGSGHPIVQKAIEKAYKSITEVLAQRKEFTIGIVGEELAFEKDIFFGLSKLSKLGIFYLKERGIERITFDRGFECSELEKFVSFLVVPKDEIKGNIQDYLKLIGVRNIRAGKVTVASEFEQASGAQEMQDREPERKFGNIYQPLISVLNREEIDGLALKLAISNIIDNLGTSYNELLRLNTLKRYDLGTFIHLINVAILSMYFSSKIGFSKEVILDIGLAALFHDIGKLYISRKIIRKPGKLDKDEFSRMESHTALGSQLVLEYVDTLGIMPVVVSFEHHLKYDLSGYPKLAFPRQQNIISQIIYICDTYDALSERRSYKSDYPPDLIYSLMLRGKGISYNPSLLDNFFKFIGVWPVGSMVSLSDKRVAVVIEENQEDIFSPVVKIIHPQDQLETIDLRINKSTLKIERFMNPWTEGKNFLHLIP